MTTPRIFTVALIGALALGLMASSLPGQYYVPLRYDLRYSLNPGYVTAIPYAQAPLRPDPYAYGSSVYSGLDLTGNVRSGKAFQGNIPFGQQGSQVSATLPSMSLSNFRRDSVGIGDVGTGVEYGMPAPYFPGSGSVTTAGSAARRFAPILPGDRAPYDLPNYNVSNVGMVSVPTSVGYYSGSTPPPDIPASQLQTMRRGGLYLPRGAVEWVNSMAGGVPQAPTSSVPTVTAADQSPEARQMDMRLGLPPLTTDVRIGLPPEFGGQSPVVPGGPAALAAQKAAAEARARAAGTTEKKEAIPSAIDQGREDISREPPREAPRTTAGRLQSMPPGTLPEQEPEGPVMPPAPSKYVGPATFAEYLERAHAQMKEGHFGAADALYEAAIVMDAGRPSALFGRIYALLGDYRYLQASLVLDRALRLHPDWVAEVPDIKAVYTKPEVLMRIIGDLTADLKDRPSNVEANFLLGYINFASGKKEEAKPFLKQVATVRGERPGSEQVLLKAIEAPEKPK
jgi:hypothetical protein